MTVWRVCDPPLDSAGRGGLESRVVRSALIILIILLAGCGGSAESSSSEVVSKADFGEAWPFTVDSGKLSCEASAVTFAASGKRYALNGTAKSSGQYADVDAIWAAHPVVPGAKKDIGPMIERGLKLC